MKLITRYGVQKFRYNWYLSDNGYRVDKFRDLKIIFSERRGWLIHFLSKVQLWSITSSYCSYLGDIWGPREDILICWCGWLLWLFFVFLVIVMISLVHALITKSFSFHSGSGQLFIWFTDPNVVVVVILLQNYSILFCQFNNYIFKKMNNHACSNGGELRGKL